MEGWNSVWGEGPANVRAVLRRTNWGCGRPILKVRKENTGFLGMPSGYKPETLCNPGRDAKGYCFAAPEDYGVLALYPEDPEGKYRVPRDVFRF